MKDTHDTKTQELIPAAPRKRGRPATGIAKSGAARQAAYLARKKNETVTVTFNRDDIPALKLLLANPSSDLGLDQETLDRLVATVFGAVIDQAKPEPKKTTSKKK
ncbi:hypothetical protein [Aeromonas salmonicida]